MQKNWLAPLALVLTGLAGSAGAAPTSVSADITSNITWGGSPPGTATRIPCTLADPIVLENPIFVKNGATLTVLAGCVVRGQPRTAAVLAGSTVGTPGALIVTQQGRIVADGNAINPIIFTTAAVDNDDDGVPDDVKDINGVPGADGFLDKWVPGDVFYDDTPTTAPLAPLDKAGKQNVQLWGSLVLLGNAPTNLGTGCGVGLGKCTVEGLTIPGFAPADCTYGGLLPHDDSGVLRYVSLRHTGDEIGSGNELNGLSLAGVGDGTKIENVESYASYDDGVEFFGGTVNTKNFAVFFAGDDSFDMDIGYSGINQFWLALMPFFNQNDGSAYGTDSGDKGGEWDGDDFVEIGGVNTQSDGTCRPFPSPQMYNVTIIGSTPDAGQFFTPVSPASANRGIQMRNGFAGELLNAIVVNTGTAQGFDIDPAATGCPGQNTYPDNVTGANTCTAQVLASTFDDGAALPAQELDALACGNADNRVTLPGGANCAPGSAFTSLAQEDDTFDPTGNAAGKLVPSLRPSKINPKPPNILSCVAGGVGTGPTPATFRGAFSRTAPGLWTDGWTTLSIAGLL